MKHKIWIFLFMSAMTGCSTIKTTPSTLTETSNATIAKKQLAVKDIRTWQLDGKIAVQSANDSGSASVNWVQRQGSYSISLSGPLGSHSMKLSGQPGSVTLLASDGKTYHANSAEQLLAKQWGFHLPVSNMHYWIRGLPVPSSTANTHYDQSGRLVSLIQQGWRIDYLSYSNLGNIYLPEKLSITSPSLKVKMIVYHWKV